MTAIKTLPLPPRGPLPSSLQFLPRRVSTSEKLRSVAIGAKLESPLRNSHATTLAAEVLCARPDGSHSGTLLRRFGWCPNIVFPALWRVHLAKVIRERLPNRSAVSALRRRAQPSLILMELREHSDRRRCQSRPPLNQPDWMWSFSKPLPRREFGRLTS